ncbi:hypothetical protein Smar_1325 [Staphylothermus marinus F1]|uniref:Uncharacterized protein n=1 Tax=Staphylothermus marinus (strain ATCC 43588 / DSM 3639 / JCM 9404 / F1) TaxID=399550 RepID=A3DP56_STAMF|nr:hypothetical protein [Staphylothermus marinus]ABN70416.1 hypothetical protein Smar_1325 [Staphylothermus marinus F1]
MAKELKKIELELYEGIDDISEKIRSSAFEAYITLEGMFQGIIRVIGEDIASVFKELISKSSRKCIYSRISLRKETGTWDELGILVCNGIAIAASGEIDNEKLSGIKLLEKIASRINKNIYSAGVIEITEISLDFIKKRLGINIDNFVSTESLEKSASEKKPLKTQKFKEVGKIIEPKEIAPAATIPVETSTSKTAPLPVELARQVLPPQVLASLGLTRENKQVLIEDKNFQPIKVKEAISIDQSILEFSDKMIKYAFENQVNISQAIIRGDNEKLVVEVIVARLGFARKRQKMISLANNVAELIRDVLVKSNVNVKKISVIVRHGFDAVKVSRDLSAK